MLPFVCDICGQKYELPTQELGKLRRCKVCDTRFEAREAENFDEAEDEQRDEDHESDWGRRWRILRGVTAGILILSCCGWMIGLLFRDPWDRPPLMPPSNPAGTPTAAAANRRMANGPPPAATPDEPTRTGKDFGRILRSLPVRRLRIR
ncbi:MAG: hypothetical protein FJ267_15950 [Planctomycetes bacterium]|nr:hypothetical protein [Planctomycetota bacterium]